MINRDFILTSDHFIDHFVGSDCLAKQGQFFINNRLDLSPQQLSDIDFYPFRCGWY